jgi:transcription antitermination protein NusB
VSERHDRRHAARLSAVQALYQMELTGEDAETVNLEFVEHRLGREPEIGGGEADADFFGAIVRGVPHHQVEIDRSISKVLAADWRLERVDSILRAILRAGTFELIDRRDVPAKAVIDEYVEIAHAFFSGDEPSFINAALDRLARRKRAAEFGETAPDDEPQF